MQYIYLDWNSYGQVHPSVLEVMQETWLIYANPSSQHELGQESKRLERKLGTDFLKNLNCSDAYRCVFLPSATTVNRLVLERYATVFVSSIEHPCILTCPYAQVIPVDNRGFIDLNILEDKLKTVQAPFLVSYMLANHEIGTISNLAPVVALVRKYGGHIHTDAVQAFNRIDIDITQLDVDYITIAGQKSGGPIGIASLIHRNMLGCDTWYTKFGTLPLPLVAGLVSSVKMSHSSNKVFEEMLSGLVIIGADGPRLPNTTAIACNNKSEVLMALDMHKICASSGAACISDSSAQATTVAAMGLPYDSIRISSGWSNTVQDYERCAEVLRRFVKL